VRRTSTILLSLLLVSLLSATLNIREAKAIGTVYIRADGSIEPEGTPISTVDNVTYTFTGNVSYRIVVERDNITIDGNGYFLQGPGQGGGIQYSMTLTGRRYVTVTNMKIISGNMGISLQGSSNNTINGNSITNHVGGIFLQGSSNNIISRNNLTANSAGGILMDKSVGNTISGNNAKNNPNGIWLSSSSNNTIVQNNLANNYIGIQLFNSSNIRTYHNNFLGSSPPSYQVHSDNSTNVWDDGYPSGGNYWSNYTGIDVKSAPIQDQPGSDGIGDTPYVINFNNQDRYPLMKPYPWDPHDIGITNLDVSKTVVGQGYTLNINVTMFNYGNNTEYFNVTVYANTTVIHTFEDIMLTSRNSSTVTFVWDTNGFVRGNYTLSAVAETVLGETDTADNTFDRWVFVTLAGDVDGDRDVDIYDVTEFVTCYCMDWIPNRNTDIDGDGDVDIYDVVILCGNYGKSWQT